MSILIRPVGENRRAPRTKRLEILTTEEQNTLYARPVFTEYERFVQFELDLEEKKILMTPMSQAAKVDAIIRLAYFRQKQQFFRFQLQDVLDDVQHVCMRYFASMPLTKLRIGHTAQCAHQRWVLAMTGYTLFHYTQHGPLLRDHALTLCRVSVNPLFLFHELVDHVTQKKITRPGYSTFQKWIGAALASEQARIKHLFSIHLSPDEQAHILHLLDANETFYAVTLLKQQPKNFKPTAIRQEIQYYETYEPLYRLAKRVLLKLDISKNGIAYYASLVEHYSVQALVRTAPSQTCLWLICFMYHRCQRMLDNLVTMFIHTANHYQRDVRQRAEALCLAHSLTPDEQQRTLAALIRLFTDHSIDDTQSFRTMKQWVYDTILPAERINQIAQALEHAIPQKIGQTHFTWDAVTEYAPTYRPLLRALIKNLIVEGPQYAAAQLACCFLQNVLLQNKPLSSIPFDQFPLEFIHPKIKDFIYDRDQRIIHTAQYEYECYRQIADYLNGRSLFVPETLHYQSLTAELLPEWENTKTAVLQQINKPFLNQPFSQFIEEKAKPLDAKILSINADIASGKNSYVKLKTNAAGNIVWTLPYTKKYVDINNPLYEKLPPISILSVLRFVHHATRFMQSFTHIKPQHAKSHVEEVAIYACLIANGTNLGIAKMTHLSDLALPLLQVTEKNYLRLTTLRMANDIISNAVAALPIFHQWNLEPLLLHASLDGQKFITENDNLLARYSQKYFGLDQGVVAYSLIANHIPINSMIIGANEHESRFLFDLIYNTTADIHPDIFSTDTEGGNKLNFLLLNAIERLYAPRYRSLSHKTESIVCYSDPTQFQHCLIRPHHQLNESLILSEEKNIQHIVASLLMGQTRQSTIISKLSSQQLSSRTKRALWEMNAVLMTDHLLHYIEDVSFRQSIQAALCRGEAYHQLRRHIEKVNGRHFRAVNETQIGEWNECARLLANGVLYYNACVLNTWLMLTDRLGETQKSALIRRLSPVAWTHVNFQGRYDFSSTHEVIDMEAWLANISVTEKDFNFDSR